MESKGVMRVESALQQVHPVNSEAEIRRRRSLAASNSLGAEKHSGPTAKIARSADSSGYQMANRDLATTKDTPKRQQHLGRDEMKFDSGDQKIIYLPAEDGKRHEMDEADDGATLEAPGPAQLSALTLGEYLRQ